MSHTDDTIEQLRFLAENWHRFSNWTRIQIIVTIWWFVKIQRPVRRMSKRLGLAGSQKQPLAWFFVFLLFSLSFVSLAVSVTRADPQLSVFLALISAGFLAGLVLVKSSRR
jgi:hypothetical protein